MVTKSLAILLAVAGLLVSAVETAAQPRLGGFRARGFAGARWAGARWGGFAPRPAGRPFAGAGLGGRGFGQPPFAAMGGGGRPYGGYGAYPQAYGAPAYAGGGWRSEQNEVRQAVRQGRQVPLSQAIEAVRRRAPGRELDAGLEQGPGGRPVYRLRWAGQDGRRQDYLVDAGSGAVLGVQGPQSGALPGGPGAPWGGP